MVHKYSAEAVAGKLEGSGYAKLLFQSDGEHSILALKREAARIAKERHGVAVEPTEAAAGDSQGNGLAEAAVAVGLGGLRPQGKPVLVT